MLQVCCWRSFRVQRTALFPACQCPVLKPLLLVRHVRRCASSPPCATRLHTQVLWFVRCHTTPPATRAASADKHGTHRGRNRYHPSTKHLYLCAAQEVCCAAHSTVCTSPPATRYDVLLAIDINMACPPTHVDRRAPPRPRIIREDEQAQRGYAGLEARAKNLSLIHI